MNEDSDFDLEFDQGFLKEVDNEEPLYYTQQATQSSHDELPPKRRRLDVSHPPPQVLQPLSTRKHHLLNIFTDKVSCEPPKFSPIPSRQTSVQFTLTNLPNPLPFQPLSNAFSRQQKANSPKNRPLQSEVPKKTLIRKFPGPAGLLPDGIDPSAPSESLKNYLCLFDENDPNPKTSPEKINDFCTQDTERIFLEGAWMRMTDNLPPNFLNGLDIASIKDSDIDRVPRMAVVIQKIDQSGRNPRVTLRDISGTIEGMMHRDLAINYPNILHSGIVLLLQDVGILSTKKAFIKARTVIFSSENLVAAFSEKDIVVRTPFLDAICSGNYEEMKRKIAASNRPRGFNRRGRKWGDLSDDKVNRSQEKMELCQEERKTEKLNRVELKDQPEMKESIIANDEELGERRNSDDFGGEDFNFEDDLFNQIDMTQFDDAVSQTEEGRVVETVAVIECRREEEDEVKKAREGLGEISSGFGDDLLNDTDSEDEYLSQIDLDAITKSASSNN